MAISFYIISSKWTIRDLISVDHSLEGALGRIFDGETGLTVRESTWGGCGELS